MPDVRAAIPLGGMNDVYHVQANRRALWLSKLDKQNGIQDRSKAGLTRRLEAVLYM